jgi:hypothetical protein
MPIEIRVRFVDGTDTVIRVMNDVNNQLFEFFFNKQVTNVYFDPANEIVLKSASLIVGIEDPAYTPVDYLLGQSVPNPADQACVIPFDLPVSQNVQLSITDLSGKILMQLPEAYYMNGTHEIRLETTGLAQGVYLYTLKAGDFTSTKKLTVAR